MYRFITEGSVEERMQERAAQKLRLDQLVIQQGRQTQTKAANKEELLDMIQHGVEKIVNSQEKYVRVPSPPRCFSGEPTWDVA